MEHPLSSELNGLGPFHDMKFPFMLFAEKNVFTVVTL